MLLSFLFKIKDHRRKQGRQYQLGHILLFAILAILSGADSYRKVHAFIEAHYATLDAVFALAWKKIPAYTTIRTIIRGVDSDALEQSFRTYSAELAAASDGKRPVAVDGKVLRGSFDHFKGQTALHMLSAFLPESEIILAHEEIAAKTNEIPAAPELIQQLGLTECVFTFDALHCQENTLATAKATGNEVIVQVKENQKTLYQDCLTAATTLPPTAVYQEPATKAHQRIESRRVEIFPPTTLTDAEKWQLVEALVKVERHRQVFDTKTKRWQASDETSFYIATTVLSAQSFGQDIRQHWGIENRDHYVRDVSLGEDASRIRDNPHIFAKLRSFALNILRANHVSNVQLTLFKNAMNLQRVLNYKGVL